MGNCCMSGSSSSMVWAGDDWGSMGRSGPEVDGDKEGLLGGSGGGVGAELRIKISKTQLDELLLGRAQGGGAWGPIYNYKKKAVLARLIERSVHVEVRRPRAWRPKLHTIPEYAS